MATAPEGDADADHGVEHTTTTVEPALQRRIPIAARID